MQPHRTITFILHTANWIIESRTDKDKKLDMVTKKIELFWNSIHSTGVSLLTPPSLKPPGETFGDFLAELKPPTQTFGKFLAEIKPPEAKKLEIGVLF